MMRKALFFAGMMCVANGVLAQYTKFVIQFADKNNSPYSLDKPEEYLSEKSLERRRKYNIAIDSADLPVNPLYIQQALSKGDLQLLSTSKWLNSILVYAPDTAFMTPVKSLPFVKSSVAVGIVAASVENPKTERFKEKIQPAADVSMLVETTAADSLNYGTSYNQVHIHNGEYLHNKGFTGDGMTIAILDAGFYHYKELSAFDSLRQQEHILGEKDFVDYDNSVDEDNAHGMYCLSTIGANLPGIMVGTAPHASFWLLRSENDFSERPVEEFNWAAAAEFADSAGADMISSSLGYYLFDDTSFNHSYNEFYLNATPVSRAATFAAKKGMIVTNSAGNEGNNSWQYLIFPADDDSVCAVGAVDANGVIASFSSYGYPGRIKPNIVSVGAGTTIFGTNNIPVAGSGTSFSNPNINGLIACLWEAFPAYNNMTILNAVYASADRYNAPDNRYGYSIPDMKKAYLILKTKQNTELYGNEWLFANPDTFTTRIDVKLIGQESGTGTISLTDINGNVLYTILLTTEQQEIYDTAFINLNNLPGGVYYIKYSDGVNVKTVAVFKTSLFMNDWLTAVPVPFTTLLTAYLTAPETGKVYLRLVDITGKILESQELNVSENSFYTVRFKNVGSLAKGVYFIQYVGSKKKTVKIVK